MANSYVAIWCHQATMSQQMELKNTIRNPDYDLVVNMLGYILRICVSNNDMEITANHEKKLSSAKTQPWSIP